MPAHFLAVSTCGAQLGLCQMSTPRGDSHVIVFPCQQTFIHACSVLGPGDTRVSPTSCAQLGNKATRASHGPGNGAKAAPQPSLLPSRREGGGHFPPSLGRQQLPWAAAEEGLPGDWSLPGLEVRRPALFQLPLHLSWQMQSTYVLQGLHLHVPNIFPDYPGSSSEALGAQGRGYKVGVNSCVQPPVPAGLGTSS